MTEATKLVCPTRQSYDRKIKEHSEKGWTVEREETMPRSRGKLTYIAYLKREKP